MTTAPEPSERKDKKPWPKVYAICGHMHPSDETVVIGSDCWRAERQRRKELEDTLDDQHYYETDCSGCRDNLTAAKKALLGRGGGAL